MAIEQTIKQRLIGAIVLVALAVIFLPSILGKKNERKNYTSKIPPIESREPSHASVTSNGQPSKSGHSALSKSKLKLNDSLQAPATEVPVKTHSETPLNDQKRTQSTTAQQGGAETASAISSEAKLKGTGKHSKSSSINLSDKPTLTQGSAAASPTIKTGQSLLSRHSWVIQVGSFSSHANAELLSKRLEEHGLKSFVRPIDLKDKPLLYRVYVGPWLTREQADNAVPKVTDISRLKPIVVKWQPNKQ